ncbi:MAG: hypothetical protein RSF37_14125 [Clostridium sp.]|uniref:hypothetical protein n=1 Tax=Clostridium sp. TaxID=1506 RepID=UPI002FC68993
MRNNYKIYGLNIVSDLDLISVKKLDRCHKDKDIDVSICYGKVPKRYLDAYENKININVCKETLFNEFCVKVNDIGIYYVKNGNEIIVHQLVEGKEEIHSLLILGTALAVILFQRGNIVIHGSAILPSYNKEKSSIAIVGKSGAGKSSLSTALIEDGNKFIADDLSVLDNNINVLPGTSCQKLCVDALVKFGYNKEELRSVNQRCEKKYYYDRSDVFYNDSSKLSHIFVLEESDEVEDVKLVEILGSEKLNTVIDNLFYKKLVDYIGLEKELFDKILHLLNRIKVYKLFRPINQFTVNEQIKKIKEVI